MSDENFERLLKYLEDLKGHSKTETTRQAETILEEAEKESEKDEEAEVEDEDGEVKAVEEGEEEEHEDKEEDAPEDESEDEDSNTDDKKTKKKKKSKDTTKGTHGIFYPASLDTEDHDILQASKVFHRLEKKGHALKILTC